MQAGFLIQDCAVQFFLRSEVTKDHRLRHSRRQRDFLGGCTAKAALRKKAHSHAQNLKMPLFARHAGHISTGAVISNDFPSGSHLLGPK